MFKHQLVTSLESGRLALADPLPQSRTHQLSSSNHDERKEQDDVADRLTQQQEPAPV